VKPAPGATGVWSFVLKRLLSFAMILGIAFLLLVSLVLSAFSSAIVDRASHLLPAGLSDAAVRAADLGVSLVIITLLFTLIYKFLPEARIRWRDVIVGAFGTAVLFTLGKFAIGLYLGNSDVGSAYGAAAGLAVLFVWVYYSSALVLLGAEFTQVWAKRYGAGVEPGPHAVIASEEEKKEILEEERGLGDEPTPAPA
jgi:membrane protein